MKEMLKWLGSFTVRTLLFYGGVSIAVNLLNGKDIFGREKMDAEKKTRIDWEGNVILGTNDYRVK